MNKKDLVSRGKQLSFLLRHDKNYKFDEHNCICFFTQDDVKDELNKREHITKKKK